MKRHRNTPLRSARNFSTTWSSHRMVRSPIRIGGGNCPRFRIRSIVRVETLYRAASWLLLLHCLRAFPFSLLIKSPSGRIRRSRRNTGGVLIRTVLGVGGRCRLIRSLTEAARHAQDSACIVSPKGDNRAPQSIKYRAGLTLFDNWGLVFPKSSRRYFQGRLSPLDFN